MITKEEIAEHDKDCEEKKKEALTAGLNGPWDHEPNRLNWKSHGLDCMMVRHARALHWCGYVGVTPGHPLFDVDYTKSNDKGQSASNCDVHGGITYSSHCNQQICHIPDGEEKDDPTFWFGFDCAYYQDLSPGYAATSGTIQEKVSAYGHGRLHEMDVYRDQVYVQRNTESLARQLSEMKS